MSLLMSQKVLENPVHENLSFCEYSVLVFQVFASTVHVPHALDSIGTSLGTWNYSYLLFVVIYVDHHQNILVIHTNSTCLVQNEKISKGTNKKDHSYKNHYFNSQF